MNIYRLSINLVLLIGINGCSVEPVEYTYYDEEVYEENDTGLDSEESQTSKKSKSKNVAINSYAEVAKQIYMDYRGKMASREGFTYIPPVRRCGIEFKARVYGHAIVAPYTGCADIAPGHYIDEATIYLPVQKGAGQ